MKNLFILFALLACFTACNKDEGGNIIKKATVKGAQLIYQNSMESKSGTRATTEEVQRFMTVDKEGNVNPIRFITERGDTLDMEILGIKNLSDEYLVLYGFFEFNGEFMWHLLVNKTTELIYAMPPNIDFGHFSDGSFGGLAYEDNHKNLYYGDICNEVMIYRFDVSDPDNITVENYLPDKQGYLSNYCVNGNGFCYYEGDFRNIKCPGGRIYNMKELTPNNGGCAAIFCGFDQQFYMFNSIWENDRYIEIYRLDEIGNNELKAVKLSECEYTSIYDFFPNAKRKTYIMSTGNETYEFNEVTGKMRDIGVVIPCTCLSDVIRPNIFLTSESLWIIEETELYQLNLTDYSLRVIDLVQCGYEIKQENISSSSNSSGLSFSGLRYADGKNVVGTIHEDGTITALEKTKTSNQIMTLLRLN